MGGSPDLYLSEAQAGTSLNLRPVSACQIKTSRTLRVSSLSLTPTIASVSLRLARSVSPFPRFELSVLSLTNWILPSSRSDAQRGRAP